MTQMTRNEAFTELARRGIAKAHVHFSGGNDEGGVDDIVLVTTDGTESRLPEAPYYQEDFMVFDARLSAFVRKSNPEPDPRSDEERMNARLHQALGEPVYSRYGSFAGEFEVSGVIHWDVTAREVTADGRESTYTEGPFGGQW